MSDAARGLAGRIVILPAIFLALAAGGAIRHWIEHPDQPCEALFSEGELRDLTGRRVRTAEVSVRAGRCEAGYGAADVTLERGAPVENEHRRLTARPGFVGERSIAGLGWLVEERRIDLDGAVVTRTLLVDRKSGWAEIALRAGGGSKQDAAIEARALALVRARLGRVEEFFK